MIVSRATVPEARRPAADAGWPFDLAPVRQLVEDGLRFEAPVTFLVGENGSGKSTLVEALAEAYGADVRGGARDRRYGLEDPTKGPLGERVRLELTGAGRAMACRPKGFFLRAETAYDVFDRASRGGWSGYGDRHLLQISHGESFLQVLVEQSGAPGLFLLDEPEAALSFSSCLGLVAPLHDVAERGGQVICATHSPLLAALPGADIRQLGDDGIRAVAWADLEIVDHWRQFLAEPSRDLRHLLDG